MIKLKFTATALFMILIISGCREKSQVTNIQNQWSGLNPTSIPLQVRLREELKGNLITNPSFEMGKHYTLDSTNLSFNLPGWKKTGDNVFWTDIENRNEYENSDASSGNHAIKIVRGNSDETETEGEGIMSDYIRVIPGNYILSLDIKLENIRSNLSRLGAGVFDAVNIRVYCYDRNKVMIRNESFHPLYNKKIDNSFKGFGFSNYDHIENFGWARVFGRSGNFPFEEGNLPEETRYVRIFAGLKGDGRMWVDRFDFRYSSKNFTLLEKLEPYFDTTLERSRYLIPEPQKAAFYNPLPLVFEGQEENRIMPRILMPVNADDYTERIISRFNNEVAGLSPEEDQKFILIDEPNGKDLESPALLLSFGTNILSDQYAEQLPFAEIQRREQSYFIQRLEQLTNVIFIAYNDSEGLQHALHTLKQLIDFDENIYHHYDIYDYPDYKSRGVIVRPDGMSTSPTVLNDEIASLTEVGVNTWIVESPEIELGSNLLKRSLNKWSGTGPDERLFPYVRKGISLERLKLPGFPSGEEESNPSAVARYEEDILKSSKELYDGLDKLNYFGVDLLIFSDRTLWESMNLPPVSAALLNNGNFNRFMFYRNLFSRSFSQYDLSTLPESYLIPFYQGISRKENVYYDIYSDAIADSSVSQWFTTILWSGGVKNTNMIDAMDLYGVRGSPYISFLDHSLSYQTGISYYGNYYSPYPGKALTGIIFKPYDTRITGIEPEDLNNEVLLDVNDFSEGTRLRLATAIDYLWNNSLYDPATSLWKILVYKYGKEIAKEIVIFNDLHFKLLSISLNMELNGYNQKHEKQASELIIELNSHWDKLKTLLDSNFDFLDNLSDLKNSIISRYYQAQKNSLKKQPIADTLNGY